MIQDPKSVLDENNLNGPSAQADFAYWSMMPSWTLDEAIALSFGKAPEQVNWPTVEPLIEGLPFAQEYRRRRELVARCVKSQDLSDPIRPNVFLGWAISIGLHIPTDLVSAIEARGFEMIDWRVRYQKLLLETEAEREEQRQSIGGLELRIAVLSDELDQRKKEIGTKDKIRISAIFHQPRYLSGEGFYPELVHGDWGAGCCRRCQPWFIQVLR